MLLCRIGFSFNDFCVGMNGRQKQLTETKTSYTGMFFFKAFTCRHWFFIRIKKNNSENACKWVSHVEKGRGVFFLNHSFNLDVWWFCLVGCVAIGEHEVSSTRKLRQVCTKELFRLIDKFLILCPWSVGNINSHNFLFACLAGINNVDVTHEQ